jgi:hypothetical protein
MNAKKRKEKELKRGLMTSDERNQINKQKRFEKEARRNPKFKGTFGIDNI